MADYEVLTPDGFSDFDYIKKSEKNIYRVTIDNNQYIDCSVNHLLLTENGFKAIKDLEIGDIVDYNNKFHRIIEIKFLKKGPVYDLVNVKYNHQYVTNGFISHNCAFINNWGEFSNSIIPTISSSNKSQVIAASTPRGLNHWYTMWNDAIENRSSYKAYKVEWWEVPGRDKNYRELMIKTLDGGIRAWNQEYACEFIGSSDTLVSMEKLSSIKFSTPITDLFFDDDIKIYEKPITDHKYVVVADGSKVAIDNFAFHIIDVTHLPFKQIGSGKITETYLKAPAIFYNILTTYNNATFICENNDGGGTSVNDILFQVYNYEFIYKEPDKKWLGVRTTVSNRSKNLSNMKLFIENNKLILLDPTTVKELLTFVNVNGKYQAESGCHDDFVMALSLLFVPLWDMNNINKFLVELNSAEAVHDEGDSEIIKNIGFFDDGTELAATKLFYFES